MCLRKYARVKMRAITYYHKELHGTEEAAKGTYIQKNIKMLMPLMPWHEIQVPIV